MTHSVGDMVVVVEPSHAFDHYGHWPDRLWHVPHFTFGALPKAGRICTITHVGQHELPGCVLPRDGDSNLYVLDGRYIVGPCVFKAVTA